MKWCRIYILGVLIVSCAKIIYCQEGVPVIWEGVCDEFLEAGEIAPDSLWEEDTLLRKLFDAGYPFAAIEKSDSDSPERSMRVNCGIAVRHVRVLWQRDSSRYIPGQISPVTDFSWEEISDRRRTLMDELAGSGYPYARLFTRPRQIRGDTLVLQYEVDTLRLVNILKISTQGDFQINERLFQSMLGLREGQKFDPVKIRQTETRIRRWDFAELEEIFYDFEPYGVSLEYRIREREPSRFDILIALVPSDRPERQYEITGNAFIDLQNQLKLAERIYLKFDKYANSSQSIDLRLDFPYVPVLGMGILAEGSLDRRDSSVMDVRGRLGVQYSDEDRNRYTFFLERAQSRLITIDAAGLEQSGRLPDELDFNYTAAGVTYDYDKRDDRDNPRKGFFLKTGLTGGIRQIMRNGRILSLKPSDSEKPSFGAQYAALSRSAARAGVSFSWDQFVPLGMYSVMRFRGMGSWLWTSGDLLENEKLRLGGFQDFRGFSEKSFLADGFGEGTVEYRFLFGPESNAYLFSDFGLIHNKTAARAWDYPFSAGIGLNLGTRAGVFGISYAVGVRHGDSFSLNRSRVNFGLVVNY